MEKHGRKDRLEEEARRFLEKQAKEHEILLEKWRKTPIGVGLDDLYSENPAKARRVAKAIENQERYLKQLNETIISQNFQTRPENVLKVVRIGTANSHRGDIFTEVALSTTDDALYFIDMTYENTVTDKQQTAGEKMYEKAYHTSGGTAGEKSQAGGATGTDIVNAGITNLLPNKVWVVVDGEFCAYDDGNGTLTAIAGNGGGVTGGTVVYATGVVTITSAPAIGAGSTIVVRYEWDSEQSGNFANYPKLSMAISKKRFEATPQPLGYTFSTMTEIVLSTTGLGDAEALLVGAVGDEHAKYKDYMAIARARNIANQNTTYEFDADFAAAGEFSDKTHAQKILSCINDIGGDIYDSLKRGQVNRIVAGQQAVTYLQKHDLWSENAGADRTGVFRAGSLAGMEVYQCPADASLVAADEMLMTFKNPNEGLDVSIAFGVLTEITASLDYPQFYRDSNIASVEDWMSITPEFLRKLKIKNLPNYAS
jgi:hypothetical protein